MNKRGLSGGEFSVDDLTWREQEILVLLADRLTNREIGSRLHLAESTVKDYVSSILSKLYVKNRREAVAQAKALGLLERDRKARTSSSANLPADPTQFIGRQEELGEIRQCLAETHLLTLTGPGGIGKTRLAVKAAGDAAHDYKGGAVWVPLAPIQSSEHIIQTIAEALRFPIATQEDPQHQLLRYLRKRELLLVMDNFEHLLEGAGIISEIIQSAPKVTILATSRERLNLRDEMVLSVRGMRYPDQPGAADLSNYDSVTLFIQRARKVRPGFEPTPDELDQITKICQIIQGMPIAIELAAAWLQILNLDGITNELEKGLDILTADVRDAPERHRSIRAVFDHSWSLLDQAEKEIFAQLSVFRGGFTREAAQQVSGASLLQLAGLLDKSFLNHDPDSGRLEIHELLRQYAKEHLETDSDENAATQEAHAAYYGSFTQKMWADLRSGRQMLALIEIEADIENVRTAWRYYLEQRNIPRLWMFINGLWYLYWIRWWNLAGMELFANAVKALGNKQDGETRAFRALAVAFHGYFMSWLGLAERGYDLAEESVAVLEQLNRPESLVLACDSLVLNAFFLNRFEDENIAIHKMVDVSAGLEDKWFLAFSYIAASMNALVREDYGKAKKLAEADLAICGEIEDLISSAMPLIVLGHVALVHSEYDKARGFYLRSLDISQETGFPYGIQTSTKYLCKVALSLGHLDEAEDYLVQSLLITKEIGFVRDIVNLFYEFARLLEAHGNFEQAVELLALVITHPASDLSRMVEGRIRDDAERLLKQIQSLLPPEAFAAAVTRGEVLDLDQVADDLLASHG